MGSPGQPCSPYADGARCPGGPIVCVQCGAGVYTPSASFCTCTSGTWDCVPPTAGEVQCPNPIPIPGGDLYVDPACSIPYGATSVIDAGAVQVGIDAQEFCRVPEVDAGSLPFLVDTAFAPSGWMGDAPAYPAVPANPANGMASVPGTTARLSLLPAGYTNIGDGCTPDGVGRSSANAKGGCWKVTYIPFPKAREPGQGPGTTKVGGGPGYGWAGVFWQYPLNNWGAVGGGYPIPSGSTKVSFWARGKDGGELVHFITGEGQGAICSDYVSAMPPGPGGTYGLSLASPPAWTNYAIDISGLDYSAANIPLGQGVGGYYGGVIGAFGFTVSAQTLPSLDGGSAPPNETDPDGGLVVDPALLGQAFPPFFDSTVVFYIDDIEFQ